MIHIREMDGERAHYACNKAVGADYRNMTIKRERVTCKNCIKILNKKNKHSDTLNTSLLGLGLGTGMIGMMMGVGNKMFGLNDDKGNLKEMMSGMTEGFLSYFEYRIDDQKEKIQRLKEEKGQIEKERDDWKERYEEAMEMLDKNNKKK